MSDNQEEGCCSGMTPVSTQALPALPPPPPGFWEWVGQLFKTLIGGCVAGGVPAAGILSQVRNPRAATIHKMERNVRQKWGLSHRQWRKHGDEAMAQVYAERDQLTDEDIMDTIESVSS